MHIHHPYPQLSLGYLSPLTEATKCRRIFCFDTKAKGEVFVSASLNYRRTGVHSPGKTSRWVSCNASCPWHCSRHIGIFSTDNFKRGEQVHSPSVRTVLEFCVRGCTWSRLMIGADPGVSGNRQTCRIHSSKVVASAPRIKWQEVGLSETAFLVPLWESWRN